MIGTSIHLTIFIIRLKGTLCNFDHKEHWSRGPKVEDNVSPPRQGTRTHRHSQSHDGFCFLCESMPNIKLFLTLSTFCTRHQAHIYCHIPHSCLSKIPNITNGTLPFGTLFPSNSTRYRRVRFLLATSIIYSLLLWYFDWHFYYDI